MITAIVIKIITMFSMKNRLLPKFIIIDIVQGMAKITT